MIVNINVPDEAGKYSSSLLSPDADCKYDQVVEIDLSTLEPHVNGPFTPDLATPISQLGDAAKVETVNRFESSRFVYLKLYRRTTVGHWR